MAILTIGQGKHHARPLVGSQEYYTSPRACQLPLDWFWFTGGMPNQNMYDLKHFVTVRCPNISQEDVEKVIRRRLEFFADFISSETLKSKVYAAADRHGITYNNCTTPVNVSFFPSEVQVFLCTERVQVQLQEKRKRQQCEDLWFEGAPLDPDCQMLMDVQFSEWHDDEIEEWETRPDTIASLFMSTVPMHSVIVAMICAAVIALFFSACRCLAASEKELPACVKDECVQTDEVAPAVQQLTNIGSESSGTEEDGLTEEGMPTGGQHQRKRRPGRTRQREARRRQQRTPSPSY